MTELMLEAQGPDGLFAVFQEDEGEGFFFAYKPETQDVLAQIRIYESGLNPSVRESDVQLMWSSDWTKCGIAVWGQMRGVINIATGEETCVPLESDRRGIVDPEWLKGFEKNYLDQYLFVRSRQRYWKETAKEQEPGAVQVRKKRRRAGPFRSVEKTKPHLRQILSSTPSAPKSKLLCSKMKARRDTCICTACESKRWFGISTFTIAPKGLLLPARTFK